MSTTSNWLKATAQRVVRSMAATALSVGVVGGGFNVLGDVDWQDIVGLSVGSGVVTFLLCVAGQASTGNGPAFGNVEEVKPE